MCEEIVLHPKMTIEQVTAWCAHHRKAVTFRWRVVADQLEPFYSVADDVPFEFVDLPSFLRPQAD